LVRLTINFKHFLFVIDVYFFTLHLNPYQFSSKRDHSNIMSGFARVLPHLGVLSHSEVPPYVQIVPVTTLD
jgi:hypothetical protein